MKKIILSFMLSINFMFAVNQNDNVSSLFDLSKVKNKDMIFLIDTIQKDEISNKIAYVVHDYYTVKHCNKDYYVNMDYNIFKNEMDKLGKLEVYNSLLSLKIYDTKLYSETINAFYNLKCNDNSE